jgi:hypothetical protein
MLENIQNLLEFIEKAKKARIKSFQIGDIKVEFSDLAFLDDIPEVPLEPVKAREERDTSTTLVDTAPTTDEDELLFWSAKN